MAALVPAALLVPTATTAGPASAAAAASVPGTTTTWAGGAGEGAGPNVSIWPGQLAVNGTTVFVADAQAHVVRAFDTATGQVRTAAGNGDASPWVDRSPRADGGAATVDRLVGITGVAVDAAGQLFLDDPGDGRVRKVDTAGIITSYPVTGPNVAGGDLALDGGGNLFVVGQSAVTRVSPAGAVTTVVGGPVCFCPSVDQDVLATEAHLDGAHAITVDATGHLYIGDYQKVLRLDDGGVLRLVAGGGTPADGLGDGGAAADAHLDLVDGLAFDRAGNLYIADSVGGRVRMVDAAGGITTVAGGGAPADGVGDGGPATGAALAHPEGVVIGPGGALYVSDTYHRRLRKVSGGVITTVAGNGSRNSGGDGGPATAAQLDGPGGIARDKGGNTYVADSNNNRVRKIDAAGRIATVAGTGVAGYSGDGGPGTAAQLFGPTALATDPDGNLFITDKWNGRVRKIDTAGIITTVAGGGPAVLGDGGPATSVLLVEPGGLTTDRGGNLYIGDTQNSRIRRVSRDGTISTVAGGGTGALGAGDDGAAVAARMDLRRGVSLATDAIGQLYIGGMESRTIRKVDLAGVISTVLGPGVAPVSLVPTGNSTGVASMAFDMNGSLYFSIGGSTIAKVELSGRIRTVAGTGNPYTAFGDGGPAAAARLDLGEASGIAFDQEGNLYVATATVQVEYGRIRRIQAFGAASHVLATGWNGFGQLGDGTTTDHGTLTPTAGLSSVHSVAAGYYHSLALKGDGTVWAWGWNGLGQLGDGTTTDRKTPVQVPGLTAIVAVAAGGYHSMALRADGTVWTWGWNGVGQLGDGTTVDRHQAVQVPGLTGIREISAGGYHNLAIAHGGEVWAWGWNRFGQIGNGAPTELEPRPVRVPGAAGAVSVAAGGAHSLGVWLDPLGNGYTYSWGWNAFGQLGDGTTLDRRMPAKIGIFGDRVVAGGYHSFSFGGETIGYAWGYNGQGQTGTGATATLLTAPVWLNASFLENRGTAGLLHSAALAPDGALLTWGWNPFGALGDGTGTDRRSPGAVAATAGSGMAAAGALHTVVVR